MSLYLSLAVTIEILFVLTAVFSEIRRHIDSLSEAYVYASIIFISLFSVSIHFFFLFEIHQLYLICDIVFVVFSLGLVFRNRNILIESWARLKSFCISNILFSLLLSFCSFCLFARGFLLPPTTKDSMTYHLPRVMMMLSEGRLFLENFSDYRQDIMPIGFDILNFLYLRFFSDYGLTSFGFLGYTIIFIGVFAFVNKNFADIKFAKTACVIAASLNMFVVHSWSTKNDLILAAIAIACFLSAYNFMKDKRSIHLFVLVVAITFGLTVKFTFGIFALLFIFFYAIFLYRNFYLNIFSLVFVRVSFKYFPFLLLPLGNIFLIGLVLFHNYKTYGAFMGPPFYLSSFTGHGGWIGSGLNLIRYLVQAVDLPVELGGQILTRLHDSFLGEYKTLGVFSPDVIPVDLAGAFNPVDIRAWYGLMGVPIIIAIVYTLFRGNVFLRVIAITIIGFAGIVGLKVAWFPWCGRYFALTFAGGVLCLIFMIVAIQKKYVHMAKILTTIFLIISVSNLFYLGFFVHWKNSDLLQLKLHNRDSAYSGCCKKEGWDFFVQKIPPGSRVLLRAGTDTDIFPFFLYRPDVRITTTGIIENGLYEELFKHDEEEFDLSNHDDLQKVRKAFDYMISINDRQKNIEFAISPGISNSRR